MKFGPASKLYKRKNDDEVVLANFDVIVSFLIYGQCGAILELDSRRIVFKTSVFINSNLLAYKNRKQN